MTSALSKTTQTVAAIAVAAVMVGASPALSQDLTAQRQAVFDRMFDDPGNIELTLEYARLSAALGDFESVAATLERVIALQPSNAEARLQLAQAYFAIGAFPLAEYHLAVLNSGGVGSSPSAGRADALGAETSRRSSGNRLSGQLTFGASQQTETDETNFVGALVLDWRVDLGGPNANDWRTQVIASAQAAGDGAPGDRQTVRIRTGPEFRITGESAGPRLQPYVQLLATRDEAGDDLDEIGLGAVFQYPVSPQLSIFADGSLSAAYNRDAGEDITVSDLRLGATLRPSNSTNLRLSFGFEREDGTTDEEITRGLRLDFRHTFDAPFGIDGRDWRAGAFVSADRVDVIGGPSARDDTLVGYGASLRAYVSQDHFVETRIGRFDRRSSLAGFDTRETTVSVRIGWEF